MAKFKPNMINKDGKKMKYLISIGVKKDCEYYDAIWAELEGMMNAVSIPLVRVDWPLYDDNNEAYDFSEHWTIYDDNNEAYDFSEHLFYAQTFETGMGFVSAILKIHEIRVNLEFCDFYNGDFYKNDPKKYDVDHSLEITKRYMAKYHPDEIW